MSRVAAARRAIGDVAELFVDANGAYERKQALAQAERFAESGVSWFEEPVYHRDLDGLRFIREHAPAGMEISIGEYGYEPSAFAEMIDAGRAGRSPGRRDAVRGNHRPTHRGRIVRRHGDSAVDALRALAARTPRVRDEAPASYGVFPRSRARRASAV